MRNLSGVAGASKLNQPAIKTPNAAKAQAMAVQYNTIQYNT
jgi:hypothetical protein